MNETEGRERLGQIVKAERMRIYRTLDAARIEAQIARGAWQNVEDGKSVKEFTLGAVESALGWPAGKALRIIAGVDEPARRPNASELHQQISNDRDLPNHIRKAMLALLESVDDADPAPPSIPTERGESA